MQPLKESIPSYGKWIAEFMILTIILAFAVNEFSEHIDIPLPIDIIGIALSVIGMILISVVQSRYDRFTQSLIRKAQNEMRQISKQQDALAIRIKTVTQSHPELGELLEIQGIQLEIQRIQQEQRDNNSADIQRRQDRSAMWQNVLQNFLFFLSGVITPILLAKFHFFGQ